MKTTYLIASVAFGLAIAHGNLNIEIREEP